MLQADAQSSAWNAPRYFYCIEGLLLQPLDENRQALPTSDELHRVIPLPRPEFGPLTEAESSAAIVAQVGDRFDVTLPAASLADTIDSWSMVTPMPPGIVLDEKYGGSVFGLTGSYSIFVLKAVQPGAASVTFRNVKNPAQTVIFSFLVQMPR
jgi:hypothetical protein